MSAVIEISSQSKPVIGNFNGETLKLRQITVEEYDLMIESGVFDEDDRIELLNGVIVEKMPKGTKHSSANDRIAKVFYRGLGDDVFLRNQNPIWLDGFSEPEPDIVLAVPRTDEYENSHPTPNEILLIVEIADSTLGYDRHTKGAAYARAGIRQYILLNVQEKTLEDYREPNADGFQSKQTYRAGNNFNLVAFPEIFFQAKDFLPV
ncbi:MAG: Uma2 family endonuclease, partial [Pyrinomonadaceae bacterium]|nr:Uma2 family endonuclease [Pyrinomonadaceae bacterium]